MQNAGSTTSLGANGKVGADPAGVVLGRALGVAPPRVYAVGCEPACTRRLAINEDANLGDP